MARRIVIFGWSDSEHIQRWVTGLTERGFEFKIISLGGELNPEIPTVVFPRAGRFSYFGHAASAAREARAFKPDLVHVHYAAGFGLWGLKANLKPMVVSVWGSDILVTARKPWYRPLIKRTLRRATAITAASQYLHKATVAVAPGLDQKCSVIPFGVDFPETTAPFPDGPLRVLYLKRHRAVYGPDILLKAIARARETAPGLSLTMAGDGPMTDTLKRLTIDLGIDDCVDFPGLIPHDRVYRLIGDHHVLAMPSRSESFGVAALEGAACGRPTIATRVGGIPEVIEDGRTGLLVASESVEELASALARLAGDRTTLLQLGEQARRRVESRYRWSHSLDQMAELYERLIS